MWAKYFYGKACTLQFLDEARPLGRVGAVDEGMDTLGWDTSGSQSHVSRNRNGCPQDSEPLQCQTRVSRRVGVAFQSQSVGEVFPQGTLLELKAAWRGHCAICSRTFAPLPCPYLPPTAILALQWGHSEPPSHPLHTALPTHLSLALHTYLASPTFMQTKLMLAGPATSERLAPLSSHSL